MIERGIGKGIWILVSGEVPVEIFLQKAANPSFAVRIEK